MTQNINSLFIPSLVTRPQPLAGKGFVTFDQFLGCAESAVLTLPPSCLERYTAIHSIDLMLCLSYCLHNSQQNNKPRLLFENKKPTAIPRIFSIHTRPFPTSGWGQGQRLYLIPCLTLRLSTSDYLSWYPTHIEIIS